MTALRSEADADSGYPNGTTPSDHALIAHICQGREDALAHLYDRYGGVLYTIALRITGDRSTAEEVIQDVFHAVWRSAGGFHIEGDVRGWLFGITRHRAIDATRGRHYRAHEKNIALDDLRTTSATTDVEAQALSTLGRQAMRSILATLPAEQRHVIELAYYAGCTCADIATRTSTPLGTVKTRLRLAMTKMRELFSDDGLVKEVGGSTATSATVAGRDALV